MMLMLLDEPSIVLFDSPDDPPDWIEAIDVENNEYQFYDDNGQRYVGTITEPGGWFRQPRFKLQPDGAPDIANALALVDRAVGLFEVDRVVGIVKTEKFADLAALRNHLLNRSTETVPHEDILI